MHFYKNRNIRNVYWIKLRTCRPFLSNGSGRTNHFQQKCSRIFTLNHCISLTSFIGIYPVVFVSFILHWQLNEVVISALTEHRDVSRTKSVTKQLISGCLQELSTANPAWRRCDMEEGTSHHHFNFFSKQKMIVISSKSIHLNSVLFTYDLLQSELSLGALQRQKPQILNPQVSTEARKNPNRTRINFEQYQVELSCLKIGCVKDEKRGRQAREYKRQRQRQRN